MADVPSPSEAADRLRSWEVLDLGFALSTRLVSLAAATTGLFVATSIAFSASWWRAAAPFTGAVMLFLGLAYLLLGEVRLLAARKVLLVGPSVYVSVAILSSLAGRVDGVATQTADLTPERPPVDCDLQAEAALAWDRQLSGLESLRPKLLCLVEACAGALAAATHAESPDMGLALLFAAVGAASFVTLVASERREALLRANLADVLAPESVNDDGCDAMRKG